MDYILCHVWAGIKVIKFRIDILNETYIPSPFDNGFSLEATFFF